jgi:hypothetical protein
MKLSELLRPEAYDALRKAVLERAPSCEACDTPIQETITGHRVADGKDFCSDCYYEQLSVEIERMPLSAPRRTGS